MPTSPSKRAADEGLNESDGRSTAGSGKAKRKPKPTKPATNRKNKVKARYAKAREEAQLAEVIPTTPDGAVRDERVPLSAQSGPPLTGIIIQAIRNGWATSDEIKPQLVEEMVKIVLDPYMRVKDKTAAFNALRMADQTQWERDHPEEAGKARGGATNVSIQTNIAAVQLLNRMLDDPSAGIEDCAPPDLAGAPGDGGHEREVAGSAAPPSDQQGTGEGVANPQQSNGDQRPLPAR